ncbi:hypothetical protein T31B1_01610 [Salinisphaera sp. T31B1]
MYAASADAVNDKYPNALHALSHMLGMSIELALKAYLKQHHLTDKEIRRLGHDLEALYERAKEFGLKDTGSRSFRLAVLGANYKARIFAYPKETNLNVIQPWSLREISQEIIQEVFEVVKGVEAASELQDAPGLTILSFYPSDIVPSAWAVK